MAAKVTLKASSPFASPTLMQLEADIASQPIYP